MARYFIPDGARLGRDAAERMRALIASGHTAECDLGEGCTAPAAERHITLPDQCMTIEACDEHWNYYLEGNDHG